MGGFKSQIIKDGKVYVSQTQYAKHRGCTPRTIFRYIEKGKIKDSMVRENGRTFIHVQEADIELGIQDPSDHLSGKMLEVNPEKETMPPSSTSYQVHRAERESYSSKLEKIKYEKTAGKLVDRRQVEMEAEALGRLLRDSILNVPSRLAAQIAAETDRVKCELLIEKELRTALEEISNMEVINVEDDNNGGELQSTTQEDAPSGE